MRRESRAHLDIRDGICDVQDRKQDADEECHSPVAGLDADESKDDTGSLKNAIW